MRSGDCGSESVRRYSPLDIRKQKGTETPALRFRIDP